MNIRIIKLKKDLTPSNLRAHVYRFLNRREFRSNYINTVTIASSKDNVMNLLGERFILNLDNKGERKNYVENIMFSFNANYPKKTDYVYINKIIFKYVVTTETEYDSFLNTMRGREFFFYSGA